MPDSQDYRSKKANFERMLTVYGRKPVLEVLNDHTLDCHALHLSDSNRAGGIVAEIQQKAEQRDITVRVHARAELARISRNGKQDQGVAIDVLCPGFQQLDDFLASTPLRPGRILALDGITNPQNLGMILRSATAGGIDGILLPRKGSAALGPLVIKASAGTVYKAPILLCDRLPQALRRCRERGAIICILDADSTDSLFKQPEKGLLVYVLGNETNGVGQAARELSDRRLAIPMHNGVESLNVAVTASLIAFSAYLDR